MKGDRYKFNYCTWLKAGDMPFMSQNPYELHNGGPKGDLYCYKTDESWQPNKGESFYDRTKTPT